MRNTKRQRKAPASAAKPPPMVDAIQAKLIAIASEPVTPASLMRLEQTARLSRELLVVDKQPEALRRRNKISNISYGSNPGYDAPIYDDNSVSMITPSDSAETFGATIIREAIPALTAMMAPKPLPEWPMDPVRAIEAIQKAKKAGLHDVAAQLKEKLMGRPMGTPVVLSAKAEPIKPSLPPSKKNGSSTKPVLSLPEVSS